GTVTPFGTGQPKEFTGKERDAETGYDYFGARYYGSKIGRFTSVDPALSVSASLGDPQRWNRYAYARNNPIGIVDPDGREGVMIEEYVFSQMELSGEISREQHDLWVNQMAKAGVAGTALAGAPIAVMAAAPEAAAAAAAGAMGAARQCLISNT